jgi:tRNA(adenine34) deaminase
MTLQLPSTLSTVEVHEYFMRLALEQAERAAVRHDEVPIGALVVRNCTQILQQPQPSYEIWAVASNRVESHHDASAHAELLAMQLAARRIRNWRLHNCTLYTTLEPCVMCLAASQAFRIDSIVYGAPDHRLGAIQSYLPLLEIRNHPFHTIRHVQAGILESSCRHVLQDFFRNKRKQKQRRQQTDAQSIMAVHDETCTNSNNNSSSDNNMSDEEIIQRRRQRRWIIPRAAVWPSIKNMYENR